MRTLLSCLFFLCVFLAACSGAPTPPAAEQHFSTAKSNLEAQDYEAALKNLDRAVKAAESEALAEQARLLRIALLMAMAQARKEMAEAYDVGGKQSAARLQQSEFVRMRLDYYRSARDRLVAAMEATLEHRSKLGGQPTPLTVGFPSFGGSEHPALTRIKSGVWVNEDDRARVETEGTRNALARVLASLVGAGSNVHKGREIFQQAPVQLDPRRCLIELSRGQLSAGAIFDKKALNEPRFQRISYEVARDNVDTALKLLGEQPDKDLETSAKKIKAECERSLKALPEG